MTKKKKRKPMPKWIWYLPPKNVNYKLKHLMAYFWWYGDKGCREWNYRIAKRFRVSSRTIRRWIKTLEDLHLIYINFPMKTTRTIYRRPYYTMIVWLRKSGRVQDLPDGYEDPKKTPRGRTKLSYISNAQRSNSYKQAITTQLSSKEIIKKHDDTKPNLSNAEGLSGSRPLEKDSQRIIDNQAEELQRIIDRKRAAQRQS